MVSSTAPQIEALTIIEAKDRAGCSRSMIYQEIQAGRLRARNSVAAHSSSPLTCRRGWQTSPL